MTLKVFLTSALVLNLMACGTKTSEQDVFASVAQSVTGLIGTAQAPQTIAQIRQNLTPEVQRSLGDRPLLLARLEEQDQASVMIEAGVNRDVVTYFTPDGISISLKQGVLVGTRGLGYDLMTADVSDVKLHRGPRKTAVRVHRYLDGEDQVVIKSFVCDYSGGDLIVETCRGKDTMFKNSFLTSAQGIVASRQWIGPQLGYIRIERP